MHAIEKLLAAKSQREEVHAGEIVNCDIDYVGINDLYYQTVKSFYEMGGKQVVHPERVILFFDHYAPVSYRRIITRDSGHLQKSRALHMSWTLTKGFAISSWLIMDFPSREKLL